MVILNEGWNGFDDALLEAAGLFHIVKGGIDAAVTKDSFRENYQEIQI